MTASHALQTLRRPPVLVVLALAAALGAGAWLLADQLTAELKPVDTVSVPSPPRALDAARDAIDTAMDVAIPTATAAGSDDPAASAPAVVAPATATGAMDVAAADPYAGAILEPVDPAEALFGDQAAVRVSND